MANAEHIAKLEQGICTWNRWRKESPATRPDLSWALLRELDCRGLNLSRTDLFRADLSGSNFAEADFTEAILRGAILIRTNLSDANFTETELLETTFALTRLRNARGLESCRHLGPSFLDMQPGGVSQQLRPRMYRGW